MKGEICGENILSFVVLLVAVSLLGSNCTRLGNYEECRSGQWFQEYDLGSDPWHAPNIGITKVFYGVRLTNHFESHIAGVHLGSVQTTVLSCVYLRKNSAKIDDIVTHSERTAI